MPYPIEILCTKNHLYESAKIACASLNKVQSEFNFFIPSERLKKEAYSFVRSQYTTPEVYDWLTNYRTTAKGNRPYIILILDGRLDGTTLQNLFGSHEAGDGLAVFTIHSFDYFVKDIIRYIGYYLVRYSLSFLAPTVKSHNLSVNIDCMFHKKIRKIEILESLKNGKLCDNCRKGMAPYLNQEITESVEALLQVISNQMPLAIVLKGGGAKGLAFVGALKELEDHFSFDTYAGASAGAITALLLGAGYSATELNEILNDKDFNEFKDSSFIGGLINLIAKRGWHAGNVIEKWLDDLLKARIDQTSEIKMSHLKHTIVYASRKNDGILTFDSRGERSDAIASFAARCSMSIPYVFVPRKVDGVRVYDGGLRNNFPIAEFIESYPQQPFIGLYLSTSNERNTFVFQDMLDISVEGEERRVVDRHRNRVIKIDTAPISVLDFNLTESKKRYLILSGSIAAKEYLLKYYPDIRTQQTEIDLLKKEKSELLSTLYDDPEAAESL